MALLDDVRGSFLLTSTATDAVLQLHIDTAIEDMRRVGVRPELLVEETMNPIATSAVIAFCHAYYDPTNTLTPLWVSRYDMAVTNLMNSDLSTYLYDDGDTDGGE